MKVVDKDGNEFRVDPGGSPFRFTVRGRVILEICADGRFLVEGRLAASDAEVYRGFRRWLEALGTIGPVVIS
jgi:hypothetical protein